MNTRETSGRYPDNDDEDGELEDPIDAKDIAEGILSGKYYCGINHCWAEELAKAYLDLVNAEPVAEVSEIITERKKDKIISYEIVAIAVPKEALVIGDKLYLRKE